jgi:hypothetical protein
MKTVVAANQRGGAGEEAVAPARRVEVEAMLAETRQLRDSLKFKAKPSEIKAFKRH